MITGRPDTVKGIPDAATPSDDGPRRIATLRRHAGILTIVSDWHHDADVRTTLTLERDVAESLEREVEAPRFGFKPGVDLDRLNQRGLSPARHAASGRRALRGESAKVAVAR